MNLQSMNGDEREKVIKTVLEGHPTGDMGALLVSLHLAVSERIAALEAKVAMLESRRR